MGKRKKILLSFVTIITILLFSTIRADAASGTITITSNKSQIVVGNTVTFTVKVNYSGGMVALQYNGSYNSSMLSLTKGTLAGAPVFGSSTKTQTYTYTFKAKQAGTANFSFSATGATWSGDQQINFATKSKSVKIITQKQLEDSFSKNNNLSSLGVTGATLSPSFSSSVTSYTVNLPPNTENINVTGKKADATASVSGLGNHAVEDGSNTIKVVVTAQNGATKTYTITAIVEELDPITVKDESGEEKTVVRKEKLLNSPNSTFTIATAKIGEEEVPALVNDVAKIVLIGLKDKDGKIELYIYDEKENTYKKYNQNTFKELILYIENKEVTNTDGTKEVTINENKINTYTIKDDEFYYFYAINLETGKENLYRYDEDENTVQRCSLSEDGEIVVPNNKDEIKIYQYIILGLFGFILLTYLIILICLISKSKKKKKNNVVVVEDIDDNSQENMSDEEKEIIEKMEELPKEDKKKNEVTDEEKEQLIQESEDELSRINNSNTSETNEMVDSINELFNEKPTKKKNKEKKTKEKKEKVKKTSKKDKTA